MHRSLIALLMFIQTLAVQAEVIHIDTTEFARLLAARVPVIDVRTAPEWRESGIIPGSHLLTYFDQQGNANPTSWLEKVKTIATPKQPIILICRSGNRTRAVSHFLSTDGGYATVYAVKGGILAWSKDGRPLLPMNQNTASCPAGQRC